MELIMITQKIGRRIRELRIKANFSQEKLAIEIDMDRSYLASVEAGRRNIAIVNLEKIAKGLGITLEELFAGV